MGISIPIVTQFDGKGIQKAIKQFKQLETNGQKAAFVLKKMGQAAAIGFAAVGAAALTAGKFMLDFANMARQDQLAQVQLAGTLKSTTKATDAQIASVENYIDVTQRATGVADDQLRPAYARLVRSTKDISKAQKLLNLALDISGRTGKPLESVVNALGKAYEGSNTALGKLGLGYSKAELKAKDFSKIQDELEKKFAGGAQEKAATFEGTMARLKITFDELKESAGNAFLPVLQKLADGAIAVADAFGKKGFAGAIEELKYQLNFLLYDQNGQLNEAGKQLNKIIGVMNFGRRAVADLENKALLPSKIINTLSFGATNLPEHVPYNEQSYYQGSIDIPKLQAGHLRNVVAAGGFGATGAGKSGVTVNVYVSPLTDPTAVGRNVKKTIDALDRRGR